MKKESAFSVIECHFKQENGITATVTIKDPNGTSDVTMTGNGRLDAVSNCLKKHFGISYTLVDYTEHSLSTGSSSEAMAYVCINMRNKIIWGAGIDSDIIKASIKALSVAINRGLEIK